MMCQLCHLQDATCECQVCRTDICFDCDHAEKPEDNTICKGCMKAREESPMFKVAKAHSLAAEVLIDPRFIRDLQWL